MTSSQALLVHLLETELQTASRHLGYVQSQADIYQESLNDALAERGTLVEKIEMLQGLLKGARDD